jgi:hypothetical protein
MSRFIVVVKSIEQKAVEDAAFASQAFPEAYNGEGRRFTMNGSLQVVQQHVEDLHEKTMQTLQEKHDQERISVLDQGVTMISGLISSAVDGIQTSKGKEQIEVYKNEKEILEDDRQRTLQEVIVASVDAGRIADRIIYLQRTKTLQAVETAVQEAMSAFVLETSNQMSWTPHAAGSQVTPNVGAQMPELSRGRSADLGLATGRGMLFSGSHPDTSPDDGAGAEKPTYGRSKHDEKILGDAWTILMQCVDEDEATFRRSIEVLFHCLDLDNNGAIDILELSKGLSSFGANLSVVQVAALRDDFDTNRDGEITVSFVVISQLSASYKILKK